MATTHHYLSFPYWTYITPSSIVVLLCQCPFEIQLGRWKAHFENAKLKLCLIKKKAWFVKNFAFKNHVLGMKLKTSFSNHVFGKKHSKKIGSQTNPEITHQVHSTSNQLIIHTNAHTHIYPLESLLSTSRTRSPPSSPVGVTPVWVYTSSMCYPHVVGTNINAFTSCSLLIWYEWVLCFQKICCPYFIRNHHTYSTFHTTFKSSPRLNCHGLQKL